jgi:hypothetical protein
MKDMSDINEVLECQGNVHNKVEVEANLESRSLTASPTQSPEPPFLQIYVQDASDLQFW